MLFKRTFQPIWERVGEIVIAIFRVTCHLAWFNDFEQLRYTVIALTISDQENNRTESKRTTERKREREGKRERERERERERKRRPTQKEKTYTNQSSTVITIQRRRIRSSLLLVKSGKNDIIHVSVFQLEEWNCPKKFRKLPVQFARYLARNKSAQRRNWTHHLWVRVPSSNLYST